MIIVEDNFLKEPELQSLENIIINAPSRQLDDTGNHVGSYTEYSWHIIDSELRTSPHRIPLLNKLSKVYKQEVPIDDLNIMQLFAKKFDANSYCAKHFEDPKIYGPWVFMFYLTDEIDGNFCTEGLSITPKRNRLLTIKTGFEHWVEHCSGERLNITGWSFATTEIIERWKTPQNNST
jgi:hypothetical protein